MASTPLSTVTRSGAVHAARAGIAATAASNAAGWRRARITGSSAMHPKVTQNIPPSAGPTTPTAYPRSARSNGAWGSDRSRYWFDIDRTMKDGKLDFKIEGSVPSDQEVEREYRTILDPTANFMASFHDMMRQHGIDVGILGAAVETIHGHQTGRTRLELPGDELTVANAVADLRAQGLFVEVIK